ncbi:MAG: filamentous hemagglutinin N-terminal domain-containing protein [Gammaproteobacteria bacterium]|nr:filamentous hemagglutinin N-terminal domain-containing protein [Gammaproteobacteria bacterium]MBU0877921.1 filamentous hemagglutinin N-terminal domain-containing protein [Alphaproteobacteria bacterium]MBU1858547.1 filamentous hemagglutinin N-terminal domain-containing protein [Gammaproteobacteria bacterium]
MNHTYRTIWNETTGTCVAVPELAKSSGKKASSVCGEVESLGGLTLKTLAASLLLVFSLPLYALPTDGVVAAGSATITSSPGNMTINQSSQNVALNWQSFNIGHGEAVQFVQPNSSSVALNRVLGADPSSILGSLSANGQVFLINPNGIVFGQGASVNVNGLVASTLDISDADFMAGEYNFAGNSAAAVLNQGQINADGGYVVLLGKDVSNQGVITARLGTVALAAGEAITLDMIGDGLLTVSVDQGAVDALVANGGLIQADGGQVLMSAQSAGNLLNTVVNNTGVIQAQTIENRDGVIRLLGDMQSGTVNVAGTLDASAPSGGDGGFIDTSAATVTVADGTKVTTAAAQGLTGTWLIDPTDYTIAATGGDITGKQLSTNLATTGVTIESTAGHTEAAGDVNVNDTVSWSANKLTLKAQNDININTAMHGSGTASLALEYGQAAVAAGNTSTVNVNVPVNLPAGQNLSKKQGYDGETVDYTVITSLGAAGSTTTIDLQGMNGDRTLNYALGSNINAAATSAWNAGAGFAPIGASGSPFTGTFDGLGHTISNLSIARPAENYVGLFGSTAAASEVRNIGLINVSLTGANKQVGALIGSNRGKVRNSYATGNVRGATFVGGLAGENLGSIDGSYFSGSATAGNRLGGLVGVNTGGISNSYSTGQVSSFAAQDLIGGLVGHNNGGTISTSYASAEVFNSSTDPNRHTGSLVGLNSGTVSNSYWNLDVSALPGIYGGTASGATGLTEAQTKTASNFSGFNFTTTPGAAGNNWVIVDIDGTLNNAGGAVGATRPMLASEYSTTINNAHQLQLMAMDPTASYTLGSDINAASTGLGNDVWGSAGFAPIGGLISNFTGSFDGLGHTIIGVTINQPSSYVGLFGVTGPGSTISNVGLLNGSVIGDSYIGALVGRNGGVINNSYATVDVSGSSYVGGLVGYVIASGTIENSYAAGAVAAMRAGGLVGCNEGSIRNSYASGAVTGDFSSGLTGLNDSGVVTNSFWNIDTTGRSNSTGGTGLTTAKMMQLASFSSWNDATPNTIANTGGSGAVWRIYEGHTAPLLTSFMTGLTLTGAPDVVVTYNGNAQNGASISAPSGVLGAAATGTNAGFYNGYYSTQHGYDISGGNLTINAAALSAVSLDGTRAYDGTTDVAAGIFTLSGLVGDDDLALTGVGTIGSKNVGTYTVALGSLTLGDGTTGLASNYTFAGGTQTATITKADLAISTSDVSKTYDGGLTAAGTATIASGTLFGSDEISGGSFAFTDKNVGSGDKTVTTTGVTITDGNSGGNYNVSYADNTTSTISQRAITVDATASDKVYDATTNANATLTSSGILAGDTVAFIGTGAFSDKNVDTGKTVTVTGITASGADAGNYTLTDDTASTTADITPAALTLSTTDVVKAYDGNTGAAGMAIVTAGTLFDTDAISGGSFAFTDPSVGMGNKTVTVSGVTVADGNLGANYSVSYADNTTSSITEIESVPADASVNLLQNARATAISSGSDAHDVSPGPNQALAGLLLAGFDTTSLAGLGHILVNNGIRLPTDMHPSGTEDDDADEDQAN